MTTSSLGIGSALWGLLEIAVFPERVAQRTQVKFSWVVPWLALSLLSGILGYFSTDLTEIGLRLSVPDVNVPGSQASTMIDSVRAWTPVFLLMTPVTLLVGWFFQSLMLLGLCLGVGISAEQRRIFTLVVYCGGITLLWEFIGLVVLANSPPPTSIADLTPKLGLTAIFVPEGKMLRALAEWVSLPRFFYYGVLLEALAAFTSASKRRAAAVVAVYAAGTLLFGLVAAAFRP